MNRFTSRSPPVTALILQCRELKEGRSQESSATIASAGCEAGLMQPASSISLLRLSDCSRVHSSKLQRCQQRRTHFEPSENDDSLHAVYFGFSSGEVCLPCSCCAFRSVGSPAGYAC